MAAAAIRGKPHASGALPTHYPFIFGPPDHIAAASLMNVMSHGTASVPTQPPQPHNSLQTSPPIQRGEGERKQSRYWTADEHQRFLAAVSTCGPKNYIQISEFVGTRNPKQVRTHAQKYQQKLEREEAKRRSETRLATGERGGSTVGVAAAAVVAAAAAAAMNGNVPGAVAAGVQQDSMRGYGGPTSSSSGKNFSHSDNQDQLRGGISVDGTSSTNDLSGSGSGSGDCFSKRNTANESESPPDNGTSNAAVAAVAAEAAALRGGILDGGPFHAESANADPTTTTPSKVLSTSTKAVHIPSHKKVNEDDSGPHEAEMEVPDKDFSKAAGTVKMGATVSPKSNPKPSTRNTGGEQTMTKQSATKQKSGIHGQPANTLPRPHTKISGEPGSVTSIPLRRVDGSKGKDEGPLKRSETIVTGDTVDDERPSTGLLEEHSGHSNDKKSQEEANKKAIVSAKINCKLVAPASVRTKETESEGSDEQNNSKSTNTGKLDMSTKATTGSVQEPDGKPGAGPDRTESSKMAPFAQVANPVDESRGSVKFEQISISDVTAHALSKTRAAEDHLRSQKDPKNASRRADRESSQVVTRSPDTAQNVMKSDIQLANDLQRDDGDAGKGTVSSKTRAGVDGCEGVISVNTEKHRSSVSDKKGDAQTRRGGTSEAATRANSDEVAEPRCSEDHGDSDMIPKTEKNRMQTDCESNTAEVGKGIEMDGAPGVDVHVLKRKLAAKPSFGTRKKRSAEDMKEVDREELEGEESGVLKRARMETEAGKIGND
ncbi:unnamed protein product [Chondrus crispus]|uniref:HTH myb-type domain-containing protein n=1 Tax=Chondrus crispus TaxID=2769 RepID=R7QDX7_CHOCR|nr:unnamed protein product [Chondrus crispus]CDF36289.1 unnamed protein product [Chondrus crispus]|eukprot:XP_005716108.1 unnamed protein product [Chondrus crispus]